LRIFAHIFGFCQKAHVCEYLRIFLAHIFLDFCGYVFFTRGNQVLPKAILAFPGGNAPVFPAVRSAKGR
jgi:hypothetical protein